ncbi:hypothetical protein F2Q68_00012516 [Brassica cretica]|uniref:Uncharacterized protein n=1 Tax=Brassica cretica TaxID=69181 RepID=A0A8S9L284_BRACR|nr:hypothetical protein F2Q68_00012516 [Brassica cretica]
MVRTPVSDPDKAPVLSTSASSSATKRSRKKKGPWLREHYLTPLLRGRSNVDCLYATNAKVARQCRRTIRASMRNKGPQQTIQHSQSTTLSEQSHTINDVDPDRVNKRTARALRMEKLIKKRVATPKKLNVAASGSCPGGRYRRPVVNKWDLVTCPNCKAIVWNAEAVVQETQNSPRRLLTRQSSLHEVMVKTPVSDPDKAPVLSTSASSSATKRSRKKKGVSDERQPWLREHYLTPLLRARSNVDCLYATNAKVARQRRRTIRASMRNKGPQQTIQHSQSTTLSEQSHTINDVDSDRVNKRTARALRVEKLIKKRVATPKKLNVAASGSRPGMDQTIKEHDTNTS